MAEHPMCGGGNSVASNENVTSIKSNQSSRALPRVDRARDSDENQVEGCWQPSGQSSGAEPFGASESNRFWVPWVRDHRARARS